LIVEIPFRRAVPSASTRPGEEIMRRKKREAWMRLQALQIAAELPENRRQALAVLNCARKIVEEYVPRQQARPASGVMGRAPLSVLRLLE
jgi:hypothetical protein